MSKAKCWCFVHHPGTPEERAAVVKRLAYFRRIRDRIGTMITLAQLGPCPATKVAR